jgi:hypothetical protein
MPDSRPMSDEVLADALGMVVARLKQDWEKEKAVIVAEARAAVAELKAEALAVLLEARASPEAVAKLRAIGGGKR